MSVYDDAVAYLDSEVHPRCDYDIYSDMRDIVDEMEAEIERMRINERNALRERDRLRSENAKLRELVEMLYECPKAPECDECKRLNGDYACAYLMRELGFEVE